MCVCVRGRSIFLKCAFVSAARLWSREVGLKTLGEDTVDDGPEGSREGAWECAGEMRVYPHMQNKQVFTYH